MLATSSDSAQRHARPSLMRHHNFGTGFAPRVIEVSLVSSKKELSPLVQSLFTGRLSALLIPQHYDFVGVHACLCGAIAVLLDELSHHLNSSLWCEFWISMLILHGLV